MHGRRRACRSGRTAAGRRQPAPVRPRKARRSIVVRIVISRFDCFSRVYGRARPSDAALRPDRALPKRSPARSVRRSANRRGLDRNGDRGALLQQPRQRVSELHVHLLRVAGMVPSERGLPPAGMTHSSCEWRGSAGMSPGTASTSCRAAGSQLATTFIVLLVVAEHRHHRRGRRRCCDRTTGAGAGRGCSSSTSAERCRERGHARGSRRATRGRAAKRDDIVRPQSRRSPLDSLLHSSGGGLDLVDFVEQGREAAAPSGHFARECRVGRPAAPARRGARRRRGCRSACSAASAARSRHGRGRRSSFQTPAKAHQAAPDPALHRPQRHALRARPARG